jgi:DNA helicase-2/ATP-dependent DNA helicase PcrA
MQDYLSDLNEQQLQAVTHINGPLMIVAGAGSGKTKVLTTRIAHLIANGVDAFHILALTFTNKAAMEMKERVEKILGNQEARNLYIGTFHSVFARILRVEAPRLGYPANFTIYDTEDSRNVLKSVIRELNLDEKHYKPSIVHNRISQAKNALVNAEEYANDSYIQQEDGRANRPAIATIYKAYVNRCFKNGALDFDDLLLKMYELLTTFPDALHKYQRKFQYILIDEFQDTNPVQYQITKLLAAMHENICVVGDDAQSIYSFRGATIENILQFQKDYDDVKVIKLEQNYRSTQNILNVANEVIKNNKGQIPKKLWTQNDGGDTIKIVRTLTDNDEARFIADAIQELKLRKHYTNKDFAILYRTNAQSRAFEENLRRRGIAYRIYGGISFYQRKEIKDFIAYLRITVNPKDDEALKRIINYPVRGIGKTTIEKLAAYANNNNMPLWNALHHSENIGIKGSTLEVIQNFISMIQYFQSLLAKKNAYEVAMEVGRSTQLVKELFNDKTAEGLVRYENIQELLNSIKEWVDSRETSVDEDGVVINAETNLGSYLQQITLLTDADDDKNEGDTVKLMTIHSAKGLEFPIVFVGGIEESIFPNGMSLNTREELEEERRLFYVAITRAKHVLYLTYANARYRFGSLVQNEPSRFLYELPKEFIDNSYAQNHKSSASSANTGSAYERMQKSFNKTNSNSSSSPIASLLHSKQNATATHIPSQNFQASAVESLQEGQKIEHQKFGYGKIIKIEGSAHNPIATIQFENNGEKKIMLNYAKLRIVEA